VTLPDWFPIRVSVLMPTFKHGTFIRRAIESLLAQTMPDWELMIIDDASPDNTSEMVQAFLHDNRVHYHRLESNQGVGAALNFAMSKAQGAYIAYLPSDDVYYPDHLERLVNLLDARPEIYLAYSGVRWNYQTYGATLQGDEWVGREAEFLQNPPPLTKDLRLKNRNLLAMVQVMHRWVYETEVQWQTRAEIVTDTLEPNYWRALSSKGAAFAYTGEITCEWVDHPEQHHKLISGGQDFGLSRFRQYYQIARDEPLNWQPSWGPCVNERERYKRFAVRRDLPAPDGLKILLVGDIGFNPERLMAFEERGHKLYGLWITQPESWDSTGPLSFGNIEDIPYDRQWKERVLEVQPDVIYALLNWQAIIMLHEVLDADLGIPFIFHFKEGPFICQEKGTWPLLMRLLLESDGQIFISPENFEWFQTATYHQFDPANVLILDGDLPKQDYFTDNWATKLSAQDGKIHTVCAGRPIGIDPFEAVAEAGIHVHFYGSQFHQTSPNFVRQGLATGFMHIHDTVEPSQWVSELSKYDAAWYHVTESRNYGDLRKAIWDDLNLPARMGTYAAAGLPWILKDNRHSRVAIQSVAQQYDMGVFFQDFQDLASQLRDRPRLEQLTNNMRQARLDFAFDSHVDRLVAFFRERIRQAVLAG
jgi:glycosyltransferase involved in cell wall biosynthesis